MRKDMRAEAFNQYSSPKFMSLLTGWVRQGVESVFATQRILMDVATRQGAVASKTLREGVMDPEYSPVAILADLAIEGTSSFVEAQKILLNLVHEENEIWMNGGKERVSGSMRAVAVTDLARRSLETFIRMQQEFLATTSKQTVQWLEGVKAGKAYQNNHLVDAAREGMEAFIQAQKRFLDVIAQEGAKATSTKTDQKTRAMKKTELSKLAREATDRFIEAQKKMLDVMGQQSDANMKAATRTMALLSPSRLLPMANLTGEGVKSFVSAEKDLISSIIKPHDGAKKRTAAKRPAHRAHHRTVKSAAASATA